MKVWKVIFATLVIFTAGLVTGAVLFKQAKPPAPVKTSRSEPTAPVPLIVQERFLQNMQRELNLTPDQVTRLKAIFAESRERIGILMDLINPELQAEKREVGEKIRAELTSEQLAKFEQLLKHPHRNVEPGDTRPRRGGQPQPPRLMPEQRTNRANRLPAPPTQP